MPSVRNIENSYENFILIQKSKEQNAQTVIAFTTQRYNQLIPSVKGTMHKMDITLQKTLDIGQHPQCTQ